MLRWRLLLSVVIVAALAGLAWVDLYAAALPGLGLLPLVVVLAFLATDEILAMAAKAGLSPEPWGIHLGNLLIVAAAWAPLAFGVNAPVGMSGGTSVGTLASNGAFALAALGLAAFGLFLSEVRRYERPGGATARLGAGMLALVYVGGMLALLVHLRMIFGMAALLTLIIVVKSGDIGAYTVGRLFGRRPMAPRLSPGKTIEGAVGHLAFACLAAVGSFYWLVPRLGAFHAEWWQAAAFGLVVGAAGMVGDLAESLLKRDVGCKDSSAWLPGFGGVLDVLDSLLLSAPVGWICWLVLFT